MQSPALRRWLAQADPAFWAQIELGLLIERGRLSRQPYDRYVGRLADETLIRRVADWSARRSRRRKRHPGWPNSACVTSVSSRGGCSTSNRWKRRKRGWTRASWARSRMTFEKTYAEFKACGLPIAPEHVDTALEDLEHAAELAFPGAPERLPVFAHRRVGLTSSKSSCAVCASS